MSGKEQGETHRGENIIKIEEEERIQEEDHFFGMIGKSLETSGTFQKIGGHTPGTEMIGE